jgi:serine/threonine protein phosphatase PrpC
MSSGQGQDQARVTLEAWLVTDVGVVRDHNEDSAFMEPSKGFFIVADGMGGHAAGEVASAMAVETVRTTLDASRAEIEAFKRAPTDAGRRNIVQLLQSAVLSAHQAVYQRGQNEQDKAGMGTTLDVVLVAGPEAFVAHVGDSRTYLIRDGRSSQITTDHTVAEVLVIEGKLTIEEAQVSPLRTILVNAIGVSADVGVEMAHVTLKRGDRLLLCSDGLHDYFPMEEEIAQKMSGDAPGDALQDMVELAKERGGHDNITGVAILVAEVVGSVPAQVDGESTQPVEVSANPFAADEPTETAFLPTIPPKNVAKTQPLRPFAEDEPEGGGASTSDDDDDTVVKPAEASADAADAGNASDAREASDVSETADDASAEPDKAEKPKKRKAKKSEAKARENPESQPGTSDAESDEAAPTELATADTGRVVVPKDESTG